MSNAIEVRALTYAYGSTEALHDLEFVEAHVATRRLHRPTAGSTPVESRGL